MLDDRNWHRLLKQRTSPFARAAGYAGEQIFLSSTCERHAYATEQEQDSRPARGSLSSTAFGVVLLLASAFCACKAPVPSPPAARIRHSERHTGVVMNGENFKVGFLFFGADERPFAQMLVDASVTKIWLSPQVGKYTVDTIDA
jgi:hypothetical protein